MRSSFPPSEHEQSTSNLCLASPALFRHQVRPLRYMAIVRTNNIVYFPNGRPRHKEDRESRMMPKYFHASSMLLEAKKKENNSTSPEHAKQKPIMKVRIKHTGKVTSNSAIFIHGRNCSRTAKQGKGKQRLKLSASDSEVSGGHEEGTAEP